MNYPGLTNPWDIVYLLILLQQPSRTEAWSGKMLSLAGWIMDIGLILMQSEPGGQITDNEEWIIRNALSRYNEDLEELLKLEEGLESAG